MVSKISSRIDTSHHSPLATSCQKIGIWEWDLGSDSVYFSSDWIKLRSENVKDISRTPCQFTQFVHPDDRARREGLLDRLRAGQLEKMECEHRVKKNDGTWGVVVERTHAICSDVGQPIRLVGCEFEVFPDNQKQLTTDEELKKLKAINKRLHKLLEASSIGIWEWFFEDERLGWDEKMHEIYGVDRDDFRGIYNDWFDRLHPDDVQRIVDEDQCRDKTSRQLAQEFRITRPDGIVRHIHSNAYTEFDDNGKPVRTIGVNIDITERREAEFALLESQSQLQRIADHLPGMVFRCYLDSDGFIGWKYISSQSRKLFGIESSDLMTDKELLGQLMEPTDQARITERIHESAKELSLFVEEFRTQAPDQSTRWFQVNSQPQKAENGDVVWDGVILEITDQKNAELELQEAKEQLECITENVPGTIFRWLTPKSGSTIPTFVSSRSLEMFGVEPADAIADPSKIWNWIHPDDVEMLRGVLGSYSQKLEPIVTEYRVMPPNEDMRWYHGFGHPKKQENGDVTLDGVVLDVTDRKQAELANDVLAKATKTKDEFLANMSHELRTPLTSIMAMIDGLQQGMFGDATPQQLECFKIVEQSSEHLLDLINEVLDLAKIESGQSELDLTAIQISKLCESCLNLVAPHAKQKQIELSMETSLDLPELIADEKRIRQVLINLLGNAVKFTPEGGKVKLKVEDVPIGTSDAAMEALRFSVLDTGIGINSDQLEAMFDPFVQVDSSLTRQHEGTGLGLSLVKKLTELHGGKVGVTSEPNRGSCFTVDLPLDTEDSTKEQTNQAGIANAVAPTEVAESPNAVSHAAANPCVDDGDDFPMILVAEDNDLVAQSVIPTLEYFNFRVLRAANGKLAVEMALEHSPDLILMDIQMPVMDGFEAARQIRAISEFSQLPIIAVSGFARSEDSKRSIESGMDLFLVKPVRIKELVSSINSLLKERLEVRRL